MFVSSSQAPFSITANDQHKRKCISKCEVAHFTLLFCELFNTTGKTSKMSPSMTLLLKPQLHVCHISSYNCVFCPLQRVLLT